jgi:hypothetical protein
MTNKEFTATLLSISLAKDAASFSVRIDAGIYILTLMTRSAIAKEDADNTFPIDNTPPINDLTWNNIVLNLKLEDFERYLIKQDETP